MSESQYPMHEKLKAIQERSQQCGEFLEWLQEKKIVLAEYGRWERPHDHELYPILQKSEELLAEFFGIDLKVLEQEKRAMLQAIRDSQEVTHEV